MSSTIAAKTIQVMCHLFSQHGLPQQLVSDNRPQFISEEFLKQNEVKHIKTAYHTIHLRMAWLNALSELSRKL